MIGSRRDGRLIRILPAMALLTCLACGLGEAQEGAGPGGPGGAGQSSGMVIRTTVRRVVLDVVVTDSFDNPVPGLTRKDFSVIEDGDSQHVLSFDTHVLAPESAAEVPLPKPTLPVNTYLSLPTEQERGPLYVMLLDLVNTEPADQMTVRSRVSDFIRNRPPGTRFAIFVLSDELRMVQGFTSDTDLLYAALDTHHPKPHVPMVFLFGVNNGRGDTGFMLQIFEHLAGFVDGLPGRKNILWVSGGFPLRLFAGRDDGPQYTERIKQMLDTMARSQVSIYPVDARGVVVEEGFAPAGSASASATSGSTSSAEVGRVFSGSAAGGASSRPAAAGTGVGASILMADYQTQDEIARVTGGHAFHSNNNVEMELAKATERGAAYYELSYAPTNRDYDGRLRNIEVRLAQKGYHLDYRRSYYGAEDSRGAAEVAGQAAVSRAGSPAVRAVSDSLNVEMQHGAPMAHDLLFKVHVHAVGPPSLATAEQMASLADEPAYFRTRRKNKPAKPLPPIELQTFAIDYALPARMISKGRKAGGGEAGDSEAALEVAAAAYDADGRMLNGEVENAFKPAGDTAGGTEGQPPAPRSYRIQQRIDVPLAATSIRIAVRELTTNRLGTIEVPLPLAPEAPATTEAAAP